MTKPTDAELEILQVLWQGGPATVRTVNEALNHKREVGYTTTLKLLQIMFEKGLVTRKEEGRMHVYAPVLSQAEAQTRMLQDLVDTAYGGQAMQLVLQALGNHKAGTEELDAIKELIAKLEKDQSEP